MNTVHASYILPLHESLPRPLRLAIAASIAIHAVALLVKVGLPSPDPDAPPSPLKVVLRSLQPVAETPPAATPPLARVAPTLRELPPPPRHSEPQPRLAPRSEPVLTRATTPERPAPNIARNDAPAQSPAPLASVEAPPPPAPAPARAAAPVDAAPPAVHAMLDEAPDPALLERYGRSLSSLLARQQQYPRLAAMRGWEGEVQVRVTIARKGNIVATQVVRSSGFEVLDQNALQLVTNAGPLPRPPEALQNRELQIIVPVLFKLEKPT